MGLVVNKSNNGLGRTATTNDMVSAFITTGVAVDDGVTLLTPYIFNSLNDAENLGINAAYDTTNHVLVYNPISEFFRMNPSGQMYFMLCAQSNTLTTLVTKTNLTLAKALLVFGNGAIKQLGVGCNHASGYSPTLSGGFDGDVLTAVAAAEALVLDEEAAFRYVVIGIEGKQLNGSVGDVTSMHTLASPDVSVVIAQDLDVAALDPLFTTHAAIGTWLGTVSAANVNEDIGWIQKFPLTDVATGAWTNVGLSSNDALSTYAAADLANLDADGLLFAENVPNTLGVFWNDSYTCTVLTSDYCYIENNRTMNKAITLVNQYLTPFLKSPIPVDPTSGQLPAAICKDFENGSKQALATMSQNEEISGTPNVYVNPAQNIIATSNLGVGISIVPTGTARTITENIGYDNPFGS